MRFRFLPDSKRSWVLTCAVSAAAGLALYFFYPLLKEWTLWAASVLTDRDGLRDFIRSFGMGAPLVFILLQVLQVVFAPIPGEATGFIGGFVFGARNGFLFSTFGLTIGSWLAFLVGRFFGKRYVRKLVPKHHLERFDAFVRHQGIIVLFLLFLAPGFPKDYLCILLGMSAIPLKAFMVIATVGRMPGTLMLSLQGALLFERMYAPFAAMLGVNILLAAVGYVYREKLYDWIERLNGRDKV
jgi:uncharacterized membrane protein YdjX (TVP38/TMEM64 family)